MDALIDFEKLIDLTLNSQEPISHVLDEMCEDMDDSAVNNILKSNGFGPDCEIDKLENYSSDISLRLEEDDLKTDNNMFDLDSKKLCETASHNEEVDLDDFQNISDNLFDFTEDETNNCKERSLQKNINNVVHNHYYDVPVEFENTFKLYSVETNVLKIENNGVICGNYSENAAERKLEFETIIDDPVKSNNEVKYGIRNDAYINSSEDSKVSRSTTPDDVDDDEATLKFAPNFKYNLQVTKELNENINSGSDDGFDPADFEFISEHEASKAGIITRISKIIINENFVTENADNSSINTKFPNQNIQLYNNCVPRKNEGSLSDYIKYNKYRYQRCHSIQSRTSSSPHVIPEGEQYLDMFRGHYAPEIVNNLYNLKNKKTSAVAMAVSIEDLGYQDPGEDAAHEKYKEEVEDCLKKIISMYPQENRRKRRRY